MLFPPVQSVGSDFKATGQRGVVYMFTVCSLNRHLVSGTLLLESLVGTRIEGLFFKQISKFFLSLNENWYFNMFYCPQLKYTDHELFKFNIDRTLKNC